MAEWQAICPVCDGTGKVMYADAKRSNGMGSIYFESARLAWAGSLMRKGRRRTVRGRTRAEVEAKMLALIEEDW